MMKTGIARSAGSQAVIALIVALSTAGCTTPAGGTKGTAVTPASPSKSDGNSQAVAQSASSESLSPVERRLREQSQATQKTTVEGTVIGTIGGGLLALLTGTEMVALAGAAAGAGAGTAAGSYMATKQKEFSNKEDLLDAMIADVRKSNQDTEALIASAREVIDEDKRRLAAIQQEVRKGQATQAQLASARRHSADNRAVIAKASKGAREKQTICQSAERQYREGNPSANTGHMQQELDSLNRSIATLDSLAQNVSDA